MTYAVLFLPLVLAASMAGQPQTQPPVEFCAAVADSAIPLGVNTHVLYFVWNISDDAVSYYLPATSVPVFHPCGPHGHAPPDYTALQPGQFALHAIPVPFGCGVSAAELGHHVVPLNLQLRFDGREESLKQVVEFQIIDAPPPPYYQVEWHHPKLGVDPSQQAGSYFSLTLRDDYVLALKHPPIPASAAPYEWNHAAFETALRDYYESPPPPHLRFGKSDDWVDDRDAELGVGLLKDLDAVLDDCFRINEQEYRERYELDRGRREKYGRSPYFAIKGSIAVLRERGRLAAIEYLDALDEHGWNCVDEALLRYVRHRISIWPGRGLPTGLVYSDRMLSNLHRDDTGCLRPVADGHLNPR